MLAQSSARFFPPQPPTHNALAKFIFPVATLTSFPGISSISGSFSLGPHPPPPSQQTLPILHFLCLHLLSALSISPFGVECWVFIGPPPFLRYPDWALVFKMICIPEFETSRFISRFTPKPFAADVRRNHLLNSPRRHLQNELFLTSKFCYLYLFCSKPAFIFRKPFPTPLPHAFCPEIV